MAQQDAGQPEADLKLGDVMRATGLSARRVRYYHRLGLLPGVRRDRNRWRFFTTLHVERLRHIATMRAIGVPIAQIRRTFRVLDGRLSTRGALMHILEMTSAARGYLALAESVQRAYLKHAA